MKVKVCYKEEIHRISNLPEAFDDLVKLIPTIFHAQLPDSWTLQYKDSDGDNILITDEKDYEEFKNSEPGTASAISKIHVISAEAFKANNAAVNKPDLIEVEANENKREEDYQVIESNDKEEENEDNKPEEMIGVKEDVPEAVPVQEEQDKPEPKEIEEKEEIIKESEVQEEPREPEEQQDEQNEEQEKKEPEEPEKAEEQDDVKAPEELHEPEEVVEKEVQEEKEEKEEEPKVEEPEVREEEEAQYYVPIQENKQPVEEEPKVEEEEPKVEEEEIALPAEEKPVEDREEQKSNVMESQYSKILAPIIVPREEKMKDSYEVLGSKVLVGAEDLKSLVSSIIQQKMPEIAQFTQQQIEESRSQLSQSMVMDQSLLISDSEFRPRPVVPKVIHYDTKCMGCGMAPIQGVRYKCTICPSFDYCEQCEEAGTHPHHFVKMRQRDVQDIFRPPQQLKPVPSIPPEWKKSNPPDFGVPKKEEKEPEKQKPGQDAKRYDRLIETAKKLQKCFPKEDFDMLCVFINDCPEDMSIEELVENYKLGMKKD